VIIAAGNIEISTLGLVAAKKAGYRTVNYIPYAHKIAIIGNKYGAQIRDALNYYVYKMPDYYITSSNAVKEELIKRGVATKISVVYTGIDLNNYSFLERDVCRSELAPECSQYLIGCVGRVLFRHKAQDFLVETLAKHRHELNDIKLLIVGDGPDLARLKNMVTSFRLSDAVVFVDWSDDLSKIYSALDMLIIPSWFEGLPLVMLEAMYYGMPIVASNIDGMAEILPPAWLFKVGDGESLVETLLAVKNGDNSEVIRKNKMLIEQEYNLEEFGANFLKAIDEWVY
jgi:glycosyltransferase involved in cell wall biosynthesis